MACGDKAQPTGQQLSTPCTADALHEGGCTFCSALCRTTHRRHHGTPRRHVQQHCNKQGSLPRAAAGRCRSLARRRCLQGRPKGWCECTAAQSCPAHSSMSCRNARMYSRMPCQSQVQAAAHAGLHWPATPQATAAWHGSSTALHRAQQPSSLGPPSNCDSGSQGPISRL